MSGFPWTFIRYFLNFRVVTVVHPPTNEFNPGGVTKPPFELSRNSWASGDELCPNSDCALVQARNLLSIRTIMMHTNTVCWAT
eukprot:797799-Amphidinium_carterae.1